MIEAVAVSEYLEKIGASALDISRYEVSYAIVATDIKKFTLLANEKL